MAKWFFQCFFGTGVLRPADPSFFVKRSCILRSQVYEVNLLHCRYQVLVDLGVARADSTADRPRLCRHCSHWRAKALRVVEFVAVWIGVPWLPMLEQCLFYPQEREKGTSANLVFNLCPLTLSNLSRSRSAPIPVHEGSNHAWRLEHLLTYICLGRALGAVRR